MSDEPSGTFAEIEYETRVENNGKRVLVVFDCESQITIQALVTALEQYTLEMIRAGQQLSEQQSGLQ